MSVGIKNYSGINSYLTAQKLFKRDRRQIGKEQKKVQADLHQLFSIWPAKPKFQQTHHPPLDIKMEKLDCLSSQQHTQSMEFQSEELTMTAAQQQFAQGRGSQQLLNYSSQKRGAYSRTKIDDEQVADEDTVVDHLDSQRLQISNIPIRSSHKYFESCRSEALEYLKRLQLALINDKHILEHTIKSAREHIRSGYHSQAHKLKKHLYLAVDEAVDDWLQKKLSQLVDEQLDYIGDFLQLATQVEQRICQMRAYKIQIEDERDWKQRASDLLTANYEEDVSGLSKMCAKSAEQVKQYHAQGLQSSRNHGLEGVSLSCLRDQIGVVLAKQVGRKEHTSCLAYVDQKLSDSQSEDRCMCETDQTANMQADAAFKLVDYPQLHHSRKNNPKLLQTNQIDNRDRTNSIAY